MPCTSVMGIAANGNPYVIRGMDFPLPMHSQVIGFKVGQTFQSTAPNNNNGLSWQGQYGFVGANAFGEQKVDDGLNTQGLYVSMQSLDCTGYPNPQPNQYGSCLEVTDVVGYLLSTCANVEDVRKQLQNVVIWGDFNQQMQKVPGLHFAVYDASGKSIVIEIIDGQVKIHNNVLQAMTNDPPYPDHVKNYPFYNGITNKPQPEGNIGSYNIQSPGPASGLFGLPGGSTSPERLVLVAKLAQMAFDRKDDACPKDAEEAEDRLIDIIGKVKVIKGTVKVPTAEPGKFLNLYTEWNSMSRLQEKVYAFRPAGSTVFQCLDLTKLDFSAGSAPFKAIQLKAKNLGIKDVTEEFQVNMRRNLVLNALT